MKDPILPSASRHPQTHQAEGRQLAALRPGKRRSSRQRLPERQGQQEQLVIDLDRYVPGFLTWIANKLTSGASQAYLAAFDTGIESWRLLVLLAIETSISAQRCSRVIGMDKASVSRAFKTMQARGLITIGLDDSDGRLRVATITAKGRQLHNRIMAVALERERALLSVFSDRERDMLVGLLRRMHENLPAVEAATEQYLAKHHPAARRGAAADKDSK
jgi:DNA-binding MarR family transcriptional regulator